MFNWIKEFIQLEMSPEQFTVPIYITQCCHHHPLSLSPLFLAPGCSSPSPAVEPFSTAHWACQSSAGPHTPQCWCERRKPSVQLRPKKWNYSSPAVTYTAAETGQFPDPVHDSLFKQEAATTLLQWPGWALEWNPSLRFAFGNQVFFSSLRYSSRLAVATIRVLNRKL